MGSGFGEGCALNNSASIKAYSSDTDPAIGASSQYTAHALNQIVGLFTAGMRNGAAQAATPRLGFTFGNYIGAAQVTKDNGGKDSSGAARCMPDYYAAIQGEFKLPIDSKQSVLDLTGGSSEGLRYNAATKELSSDKDLTHRTAWWYNGDLNIVSNIKFAGALTGWASREDVPAFYLVVNGNINIAPWVTQLDGVYIAQGGTINTCAGAVRDCGNQLVVNGSFMAKKVLLNRTKGTVRSGDINESRTSGKSAEVFNFSPEQLFGNKPKIEGPFETIQPYDSIVGLPPIL